MKSVYACDIIYADVVQYQAILNISELIGTGMELKQVQLDFTMDNDRITKVCMAFIR